tara:strand:+ start:277 stop:525 length:249 start_codon:yes stop_codon:yes gene_type:complete
MIAKTVTKLWQNKFVSVRDYEIQKAIRDGGMVLTHNGDTMTLTVDQLKNLKPSPQLIKSKFKGVYRLVDIPFKKETLQKELF